MKKNEGRLKRRLKRNEKLEKDHEKDKEEKYEEIIIETENQLLMEESAVRTEKRDSKLVLKKHASCSHAPSIQDVAVQVNFINFD